MSSDYQPSPTAWVQNQIEQIVASGTTDGVTVDGRPVILMTMTGRRSGNTVKVPVMRVEHDGDYLAVASKGGAPVDPAWYHNLVADPDLEVLDGSVATARRARVLHGDERAAWWERAVAAFPGYADYEAATERQIPLLVLEPRP